MRRMRARRFPGDRHQVGDDFPHLVAVTAWQQLPWKGGMGMGSLNGRSLPHGPERMVRCPVCSATYRAIVGSNWYWREVRRTLGYPELVCVPCLRAQERAAKVGGVASDHRNPEQQAQ